MPQELLNSPPAYEAANALEQALARVVAHVRAEFVAEKRAMDAELKLAQRELVMVTERIARAHKDFAKWLADVQAAQFVLRGERGERGEAGQDGAPGAAGERGPEGAPGREGMPGPAGERGPAGQNGVPGIAGERGFDGAIGRDGRDGLQGPAGERGKDGRDGADGKHGLGFDDLVPIDEQESYGIRAVRDGVVIKEFKWPRPTLADFHCGPYRSGDNYRRGQCTTYGGSTFVCLRDTDQKPETDDWRLIVKHGLPGRSGKDGDRGPAGPAGRDGRDLTQLTSGGMKYG